MLHANFIKPFRDGHTFLYTELPPVGFGYVRTIGWELVADTDYDWNGLSRQDKSLFLFQYTLSGRGEIRIGDDVFQLEAGKAFLVNIPGDHRYYFPEGAGHWEFLYIMLPQTEAVTAYMEQYGPIQSFEPEGELIGLLRHIYDIGKSRQIKDVYQSSVLAYRFLMELYKSRSAASAASDYPDAILRALRYMETRYRTIEGLDDLARESGLSRYHFLRLFRTHVGSTPMEHLNKLRIEKAASLLRTTGWTLDEIAEAVGYDNGNYFSKVFRQWVGISPGKYRSGKEVAAADHLTIR